MPISFEHDTVRPSVVEPALLPAVMTTTVSRVLLVEGDELRREALTDELAKQGFVVHGFSDGPSLMRSLDGNAHADIIVLNWWPSKTSGLDLLIQLRRQGIRVPVVFLTGQAFGAADGLAVDVGTVDFNEGAHNLDSFTRRLKRVIDAARPDPASPNDDLVCGKLVLKPGISRAYWNGFDVGLTLGEYNIVHLLAEKAGHYVTYRSVYDRLHYEGFIAGSGEHGYRANVRSVIKRIRNKFRDCESTFAEIENYTSFGYRWRKPG
jgi:two-component system response regulator ChvI